MISKIESAWVGYRKKYRVAGRVRVPAGDRLSASRESIPDILINFAQQGRLSAWDNNTWTGSIIVSFGAETKSMPEDQLPWDILDFFGEFVFITKMVCIANKYIFFWYGKVRKL